ncbi:ExeM/NucH family extracellular endonuclease [Petropleomorpha daqingensis]|uniref:5'-nucleotidase n=1 Tax=Petropleomorpha daqingensis TaxID=2026353 RepID=A0A853CNC1_9ACTN|nr:5'-nucleotidase [Petropleomorpha daqingensis]
MLGLTVGALAAGGLVLAPAASAAPSPDVVISEVYGGGGNAGAPYANDFIELYNPTSAPVSLSGWAVQYASATGTSWSVTSLSGSIPANGHYLVQEAAGANTAAPALPAPDATGTLALSATAGKVALTTDSTKLTDRGLGAASVKDFVGFGTTANAYEGSGPAPAPSNGTSIARTGGDLDQNATDFATGAPGPQNTGTPTPPDGGTDPGPLTCDTTPVSIGSVQGPGATSPVAGSTVTVAGTVVGDLQEGGFGGVFVQDGGDQNTATSDGIFVFGGTLPALVPGDAVVVRGKVTEYNGLTELGSPTAVTCGHPGLPAATTLPLPSSDADREALEGMLVAPAEDLTVTEVYDLNRYGEIQLAQGGRLITPTEEVAPGPEATAQVAANAARSILFDDGSTANVSSNPPFLTVDDPVRVGDTAHLEPVVLSYGFDSWLLEPADGTAEGTTFAATNPRPEAPQAVGGDLRIADFNVLNYFVDFPSEFGDDARGATNAAELAQQQTKIVNALVELDADVITLHEIENSAVLTPDTPYRAVETLIAALENADGHDWDYVRAHEDTDVITNAIIYRTDRVTTVGGPRIPSDAQLAAFSNARTPIAQTFRAGDEVFSVIANHLKSKGSSCGTGNDDPSVGGAGNCNGARVAQATVLRDFAATVAQESGDPDVLLTGDFNSYRYEPPLDVLRDAGFQEVWTPGEYSYVFDGGSGSLDHVFATSSMYPKITGHTIWDINAVESFAYEYDGAESLYAPYPYRASDHNPTVVGLRTQVAASASISNPQPFRGDKVTVTGTGFTPGKSVTATLPAQNNRVVGTAIAGPDGTVTISFTVPVLLPQGSYPVVLTAADGEKATTSFSLYPVLQETWLRLIGWLGGKH